MFSQCAAACLAGCLAAKPVHCRVGCFNGWLAVKPLDCLTGCFVGYLALKPVHCLTSCCVGWLARWLASCVVRFAAGWLACLPTVRLAGKLFSGHIYAWKGMCSVSQLCCGLACLQQAGQGMVLGMCVANGACVLQVCVRSAGWLACSLAGWLVGWSTAALGRGCRVCCDQTTTVVSCLWVCCVSALKPLEATLSQLWVCLPCCGCYSPHCSTCWG